MTVIQPKTSPETDLAETAIDFYESVITDVDDENEDEETRWLRHERLAHKSMHWLRRPSVVMISIVGFLSSFSLGFSTAPKVSLLMQLICRAQLLQEDGELPISIIPESCDKGLMQVEMSALQSWSVFLLGAIVIMNSSKIGQLSDIHGRKYMLLFNLAVTVISSITDILLVSPVTKFYSRWAVILSSTLDAIGGSSSVFNSLGYSYVIDVVEEEERTYCLGLFTASIQLARFISPLASSEFIKYVSHSDISTLYIALGISIFLVFFVLLILPESRSERSRKKSRDNSLVLEQERNLLFQQLENPPSFVESCWISFKSFFTPMKLLWLPVTQEDGTKDYQPRITFILLQIADMLWNLSSNQLAVCVLLYATYMFDWTAVEMGYFISSSGVVRAFTLFFISPMLLHQIKLRFKFDKSGIDQVDLTTMRLAFVFAFIATIMLIFAKSTFQIIFAFGVEGFGVLFQPAFRTAIVKYSPPGSTGTMLGAISALETIMDLLGQPMFLYIYSSTVNTHPAAFFYVGLVLLLMCGVIIFFLLGSVRHKIGKFVNSHHSEESSGETQSLLP